MSIERLERVFADTREVLATAAEGDLTRPTPCASWDVRALANHVVEGANWFGLCVEAGAAPDPDPTKGVDYAAGDLLGDYDRGVQRSLAAFGAPGALEATIALPFGELPGAVFLSLATDDIFVHGWDLARATGQHVEPDDALAAELLAEMRQIVSDDLRGPDGSGAPFGAAVDSTEATPVHELMAFLGRTP